MLINILYPMKPIIICYAFNWILPWASTLDTVKNQKNGCDTKIVWYNDEYDKYNEMRD